MKIPQKLNQIEVFLSIIPKGHKLTQRTTSDIHLQSTEYNKKKFRTTHNGTCKQNSIVT